MNIIERLRVRGNGDIADGYEDKTERGQFDLEVVAELVRLQGEVDRLKTYPTDRDGWICSICRGWNGSKTRVCLLDHSHLWTAPGSAQKTPRADIDPDAAHDRGYLAGAQAALVIAHQSMQAAERWLADGCGTRRADLSAHKASRQVPAMQTGTAPAQSQQAPGRTALNDTNQDHALNCPCRLCLADGAKQAQLRQAQAAQQVPQPWPGADPHE
jgi:hypothetical protein